MSELEAGRELDALIHERVMGHEPRIGPSGLRYGFADFKPVPLYSTDIKAAWEVAGEIIRREKPLQPWGSTERYFEVSHSFEGWVVRIGEPHWNDPFGPEGEPALRVEVEKQPTAPLAICRAALSALARATREAGEEVE